MAAFIRREWAIRKTGYYKGHVTPHLHIAFFGTIEDPDTFKKQLFSFWIDTLKPQYTRKVFQFCMDDKENFTPIRDPEKTLAYMLKPLKYDVVLALQGRSIGRSWFKVGNLPFAEPIKMELTDKEANVVKRVFRKIAKAKDGKLTKAFNFKLKTAGQAFYHVCGGPNGISFG